MIHCCYFFNQVLTPIPGGISQQTGVIIQPQQILFTGNKAQVIPTTVAAPTSAQAQISAAGQQQPQQQAAQPQAPLMLQVDGVGDTSSEDEAEKEEYELAQSQALSVLQVDGAGDTSSEEEEEEEEDYDDDEEEDKEKDGGEDGQVEEVNFDNICFKLFYVIPTDAFLICTFWLSE